MSFDVVINGPAASAGSIFSFLRKKGTDAPKEPEKRITVIMLTATPKPSRILDNQNVTIAPSKNPHRTPLIKATNNSIKSLFPV